MKIASGYREAVRFSFFLLILLALGAAAVRVILSIIEELPNQNPQLSALLSFSTLSVTLAFMCIAGAVAVWALRHSAAQEGRLRVGRFVSQFDAVQDGLLIVDHKGRVLGCNSAAGQWAGIPLRLETPLETLYPFLTAVEVAHLLKTGEASELEKTIALPHSQMVTLRFRSQPAEDLHILFLSDVTARRKEEERKAQLARFQLIGRIARGVAFDFNNILCAIASHATVLPRFNDPRERQRAAEAIVREAERGVTLSRHLLDLTHAGLLHASTSRMDFFVQRAADLLRIALSSAWTVQCETDRDFPRIPLSGIQIEQTALNLGLFASDALERPGVLRLTARKPTPEMSLDLPPATAAILVIEATLESPPPTPQALPPMRSPDDSEGGMILSVVRAIIEECGGRLDTARPAPNHRLFRVAFPLVAETTWPASDERPRTSDLLEGMKLLLAIHPERGAHVSALLRGPAKADVRAEVHDPVALLVEAERQTDLDVILVEQALIGAEMDAFLRALMKLRPRTGLLLLTDGKLPPQPAVRNAIFIPLQSSFDDLARGILEAKGLALRLG